MIRWHTGWPGGLKEIVAGEYHKRFPDRILRQAVMGMLPPNNLRKVRDTRLKIFPGPHHNHSAQKPELFALQRTVPEDLHVPWGLVPEYTITLTRHDDEKEKGGFYFQLEARPPENGKERQGLLKKYKKEGKLGKANRRKPHPVYVRGGFVRDGVKLGKKGYY
eukprot:TRINITY_DN3500_c0_g1_i1.p1 TRINITY_DN3500_c0_g1~~TRINITY_DN3500_c0_g1_i1.p1  ORF type:complete len:163 (-),score=14.61 TRINITY_DN3500_c0_g1_i1:76-564(-)